MGILRGYSKKGEISMFMSSFFTKAFLLIASVWNLEPLFDDNINKILLDKQCKVQDVLNFKDNRSLAEVGSKFQSMNDDFCEHITDGINKNDFDYFHNVRQLTNSYYDQKKFPHFESPNYFVFQGNKFPSYNHGNYPNFQDNDDSPFDGDDDPSFEDANYPNFENRNYSSWQGSNYSLAQRNDCSPSPRNNYTPTQRYDYPHAERNDYPSFEYSNFPNYDKMYFTHPNDDYMSDEDDDDEDDDNNYYSQIIDNEHTSFKNKDISHLKDFYTVTKNNDYDHIKGKLVKKKNSDIEKHFDAYYKKHDKKISKKIPFLSTLFFVGSVALSAMEYVIVPIILSAISFVLTSYYIKKLKGRKRKKKKLKRMYMK
ncbi:hypothetical protein MKS88_002224 [Plasmodium brasilianum]|uniref:Uncharacterized protein n=1 Tax=Plasmodium brasilianum TaxID=5824 RepID=A0ACB9Y9G0_PLABR|nr:hypothetical protein MKS88_002224 [Plasmodium brasilianum]